MTKTKTNGRTPQKRVLISCGSFRPEGAMFNKKFMETAGYIFPEGFRPVRACSPEKGFRFSVTGEPARFRREVKIDLREDAAIAVIRIEADIDTNLDSKIQVRITNLDSKEQGNVSLAPGEIIPMYIGDIAPHRRDACNAVMWQMNRFARTPGLFCEQDKDGNSILTEFDKELIERMPARVRRTIGGAEVSVGSTPKLSGKSSRIKTGIAKAGDAKAGTATDSDGKPQEGFSIASAFDEAGKLEAPKKVPVVNKPAGNKPAGNKGVPDPGHRLLCIKDPGGELLYVPLRELQDAIARAVEVTVVSGRDFKDERPATDAELKAWTKMARVDGRRHARNLVEE